VEDNRFTGVTSIGLPPGIGAGLAAIFTIIGSIVIFLLEHINIYVIAWCIQVMFVSCIFIAVYCFLAIMNAIFVATIHSFWVLYVIYAVNCIHFIIYVIMIVLAFLYGETENFYQFPLIGRWCLRHAEKRVQLLNQPPNPTYQS